MVSNDDFDGKATHLNCFYLHINFEQKYPKPAIVRVSKMAIIFFFLKWMKIVVSTFSENNPYNNI